MKINIENFFVDFGALRMKIKKHWSQFQTSARSSITGRPGITWYLANGW